MKIIQGVLFTLIAVAFVLGSMVEVIGGLARWADELYFRVEEW